jgi:hypothetical protein
MDQPTTTPVLINVGLGIPKIPADLIGYILEGSTAIVLVDSERHLIPADWVIG